jgi:alanine dehydrogenase
VALLIKDEDIAALAPMAEIVEAMEIAMSDHARALAPFYPERIGVRARPPEGRPGYALTTQIGGSVGLNVMAVRLMSNMTLLRRRGERTHADQEGFKSRNWGITVLFDMQTGELMAILPQFTLSGLRVGANTGLATKLLARPDAEVAAVFGSSKVARGDIEGVAHVRKLKQVRVYSPNPEHRADFVRDMSEKLGVQVIAVDVPRRALDGADIVTVSTGSRTPVFDGDWLAPGQFISCTMSSPYPRRAFTESWKQRYPQSEPMPGLEIDEKTLVRADAIATLSREMILNENQRDILDLIDAGKLDWSMIREIGDIAAGLCPGRQTDDEILLYKSSGGIGLQMAAIGAVVVRNARKKGIGQEIEGDWFSADMSYWHEKGFAPTQ